MDCSRPGLPVHHQLLEITQTHVHRVGDAIQSSHPLSSPSLPTSVFPSIRVFSSESALLIRWPKYWSFSFNISPSNEYSGLGAEGAEHPTLLTCSSREGSEETCAWTRVHSERRRVSCHSSKQGGHSHLRFQPSDVNQRALRTFRKENA